MAVVIAVVAFLAMVRVDTFLGIEQKKLLNAAVDGCSNNSRYIVERSDNGVRTEEAISDRYKDCMKAKGF